LLILKPNIYLLIILIILTAWHTGATPQAELPVEPVLGANAHI